MVYRRGKPPLAALLHVSWASKPAGITRLQPRPFHSFTTLNQLVQVETVMHHMPLDEVADQMAVQFLQQRLPPPPRKASVRAVQAHRRLRCRDACLERAGWLSASTHCAELATLSICNTRIAHVDRRQTKCLFVSAGSCACCGAQG